MPFFMVRANLRNFLVFTASNQRLFGAVINASIQQQSNPLDLIEITI